MSAIPASEAIKRSFAPQVDTATRLLVLGSLPGDRSLVERRYYAHPQNQFWRLMGPAAGCDLTVLPYAARLAALGARGIGLWDVVAAATRIGSSDAAIRDVDANDLPGLVMRLPRLRAVAFNGATAAKLGTRQLTGHAEGIVRIALPSSSALHTIGIAAKQPAWSALAQFVS